LDVLLLATDRLAFNSRAALLANRRGDVLPSRNAASADYGFWSAATCGT
jgi:hypothetical protein